MTPRFGTDGIRGVANTELTPELALALGRAAARHLRGGAFLVGRDTRRSGTLIQAALSAGLASEGMDVVDVGVIPTPGLAFIAASRELPAAMISASHNPFSDNGIKLLSGSGTKLADDLERAIEAELDALTASGRAHGSAGSAEAATMHTAPRALPSGAGVGALTGDAGALGEYADHLVAVVGAGAPGSSGASGSSDARAGRFRVVCDCANGAASAVAPAVLRRLGLEPLVIHAEPDGLNINTACGSTNIAGLARAVVESGADLGLAFDGDADRVLAVDHEGSVVDGDQLLCLFALDLDGRGELEGRAVVATVMSNLGLHRSLRARGIAVVETPVGDRHVADALESNGLVLGGEQSGHVVLRKYATTGDGILTAVKLLELLGATGERLADLAGRAMTRLPQVLTSIPVGAPGLLAGADGVHDAIEAARRRLGEAGRVLVRASGTEPMVRVMVEAETEALAAEIVEALGDVIRVALGAPR